VLLAACASSGAVSEPDEPSTTAVRGPRLSAAQEAALERLASLSGPIDPAVDVHRHDPVALASTLSPDEQARFDEQINAAVEAAKTFPTLESAAAQDYAQSSTQLPGIGTHWVRWSLVDQPFDPAQPAMLLFDQSELHPPRLAGFSYWVRSEHAPEGFAGPNDVWHRHSGLCFEDGFLVKEDVPAADQCGEHWLNGSDLWMLHAWVAPNTNNDEGVFAPRNKGLCPPDWQQLPDLLKCGADAGGHEDGVVQPVGDFYCHLPST
jgi:hypothetical protein